jgi:WD40 repeat protein
LGTGLGFSTFVAISPDDKFIVAGGAFAQFCVWRWSDASGAPIESSFPLHVPSDLFGATFLDSRRLVTAGRDGAIRCWDICNLPAFHRIPVENDVISEISLNQDGTCVKSYGSKTSFYQSSDGSMVQESAVSVGDFPDNANRETPEVSWIPDTSPEETILLSSNSKTAATIRGNGQIRVWNDRELIWQTQSDSIPIKVNAIYSNGRWLTLADHDGSIHIIDFHDNTIVAEFPVSPPSSEFVVSPDGKTLVSVSFQARATKNFGIKLWNVATGRQLLELDTGCEKVSQLKFSADGRTLAGVGRNALGADEILVWTTNEIHAAK